MNAGRTLSQLAEELERQRTTRKDYVAPQGKMVATVIPGSKNDETGEVIDGDVVIDGLNGEGYGLTPHAHGQLADTLGIPRRYYDRMFMEQPDLLAHNVNAWLRTQPEEKKMVRTLDGRVRGILTPKFRPLDNFELASAVLPKLQALRADVLSCQLTETRMYIKCVLPSLSDTLPDGQTWGSGHNAVAAYRGEPSKVVAAIVISNSEVGAGSLRVEPSVFTTWCTNLAIMSQVAMRKYHVGRSLDAGDDMEIFTDATRAADDRAFWLKVQDVTAAAFNPEIFKNAVERIRMAAGSKITSDDLPAVVDLTVKQLALPEKSASGILTWLARGGDFSQWGLSSAITALANDAADYEESTLLERAGGAMLALPARDWNAIAKATRTE